MFYLKKIVIIAALLPMLTACLGGYKIWGSYHSPSYTPQQFGYFNQNKDLETVVFGNPFDEDKKNFGIAVTDAMQGRNAGGKTNFTTMPNDTNNPSTYFAIQFNPDMTKLGRNYCSKKAPLEEVQPPEGRVNMMMAYCENAKAISYVKGGADASSSNDEEFVAMIGRAVRLMIPVRNPNDTGNSCRGPSC